MVIETAPPQSTVAAPSDASDLHGALDAGWIVPGQHVLDLGCGLGADLIYLAHHGVHACGIDVSAASLVRSPEQRAQVLQADVLHLPFADETFDVLVDRGCLHYVPVPARPACVAELKRVLRPHGRLLLLSGDNEDSTQTEVQRTFEAWTISPLEHGVGYALFVD